MSQEPLGAADGGAARTFTEEERLAYWDEMVRRAEAREVLLGPPHVLMRIGGYRMAIEATACLGVVSARPSVPLPTLPPYIIGVASIRGRPISVTDITQLLGIEVTPGADPGHLLLVSGGGEETALHVDWIDIVQPVDVETMVAPEGGPTPMRSGLIKGMVIHQGRRLYLLDHRRCLRPMD